MRTVFKNCTLLDGTLDMQPKPGTDVAIENGIITEIGSVAPKSSDEVIDLTGKYLMPGLINLHVHLPAGGKPKTSLLKQISLQSLLFLLPL